MPSSRTPSIRRGPRDPLLTKFGPRIQKEREGLTGIRFFLKGSLVKRYLPCGNPKCRCHRDRKAWHGPFYQWTRKLNRKTEGVWIPKEVVGVVRVWMRSGDRFVAGAVTWEEVSVEALKELCREARVTRKAGRKGPK